MTRFFFFFAVRDLLDLKHIGNEFINLLVVIQADHEAGSTFLGDLCNTHCIDDEEVMNIYRLRPHILSTQSKKDVYGTVYMQYQIDPQFPILNMKMTCDTHTFACTVLICYSCELHEPLSISCARRVACRQAYLLND